MIEGPKQVPLKKKRKRMIFEGVKVFMVVGLERKKGGVHGWKWRSEVKISKTFIYRGEFTAAN